LYRIVLYSNCIDAFFNFKETERPRKRNRKVDPMTDKKLKQAAAEAEAAPKDYAVLKGTLQKAESKFKKTGVYLSKHFCISKPDHFLNSVQDIMFSSFYFSTKEQSAAQAHRIVTFLDVTGL
jgi:hypothetical protein